MKKVLTFEGAGWAEADSNGVGNCRIRTTFLNDKGKKIYLEMSGTRSHKSSPPSMKAYNFPWHIWHCFYDDCNETSDIRSKYESKHVQEYTQESILRFVNDCLDCSFDEIKIVNDSQWNGFAVDGKEEAKDDNN